MHRYFETQLDNENVFLVIRKHWIVIFGRVLFILLLLAIGIAIRLGAFKLFPNLDVYPWVNIANIAFILYLAILWVGLFLALIFYYLHLQIITSIRLVDVNQSGLFKRNVVELQLENVEDVTSETFGPLETILNYGDVIVQTSGAEMRNFTFESVSHPERVKKLILDLYEKRLQKIK